MTDRRQTHTTSFIRRAAHEEMSGYYSNTGAYGSNGGFQNAPSSGNNMYGGGGYGGVGDDKNKKNSNPYNQNPNPYGSSSSIGSSSVPTAASQQWQPPAQTSNPNLHQGQSVQNVAPAQQQQQAGTPLFWNPAVASSIAAAAMSGGANNPDAMFNLAQQAGNTFLDQGTARMIPGLERIMRELRVYFAVDNSYVKTKMLRVLFSFFFKRWKRMEEYNSDTQGTGQKYALPTSDDNALDLYIPSMSLVTYVLLCALCYGTAGEFEAEVMPDVMTKCIIILILEVLAFRLGFYLMQAPTSFMDLFAVTGYKFLGLTVNMLVGLFLGLALNTGGMGHKGYYATFLWTASAASYFMLKFLANNIPNVTASTGPKRDVMVLAFAGSQFASMWFLGQTKVLN